MIIRFERSGGFTGIPQQATVDSETLAPQEKQSLLQMVEAAGFFELPEKISAPPGGADRFSYRLAVESDSQCHTVEVDEAVLPVALQPLIQHLEWLARRGPIRPD